MFVLSLTMRPCVLNKRLAVLTWFCFSALFLTWLLFVAPWPLVLPRFLLAQVSFFAVIAMTWILLAFCLGCLLISPDQSTVLVPAQTIYASPDRPPSTTPAVQSDPTKLHQNAPQTHIYRNDTGGSSWSGGFSTLSVVCRQQPFVPRQYGFKLDCTVRFHVVVSQAP